MSEVHFRHAIEMDPNDTESHLGYAHLLSNSGRNEQALVEVQRARELSPFYMAAAALEGGFLLRAQRPEEAVQRLEFARQIDENFWLTRIVLAGTYMMMDRSEDALVEARIARQLSGGGTWAAANEIRVLVRLGRRDEAETLLEEMLQRSADQYVPPYDMAVAYQALGDDDAALAWLERAYEARDPKLAFLGLKGTWSSIRGRPEYIDLTRRMNLIESQE